MQAVSHARHTLQPTPGETDPGLWIRPLQAWLAVGIVVLMLFPAMRGVDAWFGWLPFWLVVAPTIDLVVLRRRAIGTWLCQCLVRWRAHRHAQRRQARPARGRARRVGSVRRRIAPAAARQSLSRRSRAASAPCAAGIRP